MANRLTKGSALVSDLKLPVGVPRIKRLELAVPDGTEQAVWTLPRMSVVQDLWIHVKTAEATGGTKTLDIGTNSTGGTNDPDGFADAASVATTGIIRPEVAVTTTTEGFSYFSANTRGVLLSDYDAGTTALTGLYREKPAELVTAESLTITAGSTDFAELDADLYIQYITLTS